MTDINATPWPDGSFLGFDVESTGIDVETAHIVTATTVIVVPGAPNQPTSWLADPGVEIPAEATEVHGITTAHARECGEPIAHVVDAISEHLTSWWRFGLPIVAFNAAYDITVLDRELRRHHDRGLSITGPVLDPFVIDKALSYRKGKRTLVDVCAHYGVDLTAAHTSDGDALAAVQLMPKLARLHSRRHGRLIGQLSLRELWTAQVRWAHEQAVSFEQYQRGLMLKDGATAEDVAAVVIPREWPLMTLAAEPAQAGA